MNFANSFVRLRRLLLVSLLPVSVGGCLPSLSAVQGRVPLTELDSYVREPCPDPGLRANLKEAVLDYRLALSECEGKRGLAVGASDAQQPVFGVRTE